MSESSSNSFIDRQVRRNSDSQDHWTLAATHRAKVTNLIVEGAKSPTDRLCILGAGNCNDLDLTTLDSTFAEFHLVDIDREAIEAARERQHEPHVGTIHCCDLTGVLSELSQWPQPEAIHSGIVAITQKALTFEAPQLDRPFEVVASVCLLSQLTEAVALALGQHHLKFHDLLRAIRHRHLRLLCELVKPGGTGILITDFVSSDSAPNLPHVAESELPGELSRLINDRNFFHGLNPAVLSSLLQTDPQIARDIEAVETLEPWIWNFGIRHYAVAAFRFRRRN